MTRAATSPKTLAELRHASGLSLSQVADRMGVGKSRISHIEAVYPNVNYGTLTRYIQALGGSINFTVGTTHAAADMLVPDPQRKATREYRQSRPGMGELTYTPASAAEELVLQGQQPEPGGDDTGRNVDHADAQGDQRDGAQGQ